MSKLIETAKKYGNDSFEYFKVGCEVFNREELLERLFEATKEIIKLQAQVDLLEDNRKYLNNKIYKSQNEIQYIIDYGFDYDGFNNVKDLKELIDMLVDYARKSKDILKGDENNG